MNYLISSLKIVAASLLICVGFYTMAVLAIAQLLFPDSANGSLVKDETGKIRGSHLVAQDFRMPQYFWPRPSAVDYDGAGAGGSNLSPRNPAITDRAEEILLNYEATPTTPVPPDLVTASGSGLDPHISEAGALRQVDRIAQFRGLDTQVIINLINSEAFAVAIPIAPERIVNVLDLNLALDRIGNHKA